MIAQLVSAAMRRCVPRARRAAAASAWRGWLWVAAVALPRRTRRA